MADTTPALTPADPAEARIHEIVRRLRIAQPDAHCELVTKLLQCPLIKMSALCFCDNNAFSTCCSNIFLAVHLAIFSLCD